MLHYRHRTLVAFAIFFIGFAALLYISWIRRKRDQQEHFKNIVIPTMQKHLNDVNSPTSTSVPQETATFVQIPTVPKTLEITPYIETTKFIETQDKALPLAYEGMRRDEIDEDIIVLETIADLFNVPDDVMDEYGITKDELERRVLFYRSNVLQPKQRAVAHTQGFSESKQKYIKNVSRETAKQSISRTPDKGRLSFNRRNIYTGDSISRNIGSQNNLR